MSDAVIKNCNYIDLETGMLVDNVVIFIKNGLIAKIVDKQTFSIDKSVPIIDLNGYTLLPGLINVHNNLSMVFPFKLTNPDEPAAKTVLRCYRRALDALYSGITCLRTVGEINRVDIYLRDMINAGIVEGPTIIAGGKGIGVTGGHGSTFGQIEADGPEEFRKAARKELAYGTDHLKIFVSGGIAMEDEGLEEMQMTREEISAVTSVARYKRTYVAAHISGSDTIIQAAEAGVKSFEHCYVMNRQAAKAIKSVNGYVVPTLSVTRSPEWMQENNFESWIIEKALAVKDKHMESIRLAIDEGVMLACGTDLPPGDLNAGVNTTVKEIEFIKEAGLTELDAIRTATINASRLCQLENRLGLIKIGYDADLIAVTGNPLKDIKQLENIKFVMKKGRVIRNDI